MMIPGQSYCFSGVVTLYIFLLVSFVLHTLASPTVLPNCHHDQRDALLEFKHEFPVNDVLSLSSWNKSSGCCSWEGVTCDAKSGEVISLLLDSISLNSSLEPKSGLFKLQHLFNLTLRHCSLYGEIPFSLGNLSRLTLLDLSYNNLVGIPASIGKLSRLTLLDLSSNNLVGQVPASIGNLTQLGYISLRDNKLNGNIAVSFANLTKLSVINLYNNNFESTLPPDMSGFHNLNDIEVGENSFFGPFPTSLFKNPSLEWVDLGRNQFKGPIEFGNTSSSSRLEFLYLSDNQFDGRIPESLYEFRNLKDLSISNNNFIGPFPRSLFKVPSISNIDLGGNQFKGPIEFGNTSSSSTTIEYLILAQNKLDGPIPKSISEFLNLRVLDLSDNKLTGSIPGFMSKLVNLDFFHVYNNKLVGQVPGYLWGMNTVKFSHNSFSSIEKSSKVFDETNMVELDLSSNSLPGPFPRWICKLRSLRVLDLSSNNFSGSIPQCLRNSTGLLEELILRDNNFSGALPDIFFNATNLKTLDVSANQLIGKLPKSLIYCKAMQLVNVRNNGIKDKFPSWLGSLPSLNVILLRTNQFFGPLYHHHISIGFQSLRVIDVSDNYFTGTLPSFYFSDWHEMTTSTKTYDDDTYMEIHLYAGGNYSNSMEMVHKGVDTEFERIRKDFRAIDFSGNRFSGKIPDSIGLLKQVRLLNLSGNAFTGTIPQSLAILTNLEALDLSRNQLSGQIPPYFGSLSFLSIMNFSSNNLQGPIPRGTQFQRQNCSSFMDNPKLYGLEEICGKTHNVNPTPQESEDLLEQEEQRINWIAAAIAYGPGIFCGLVIGHIFLLHKHEWFMEKFIERSL